MIKIVPATAIKVALILVGLSGCVQAGKEGHMLLDGTLVGAEYDGWETKVRFSDQHVFPNIDKPDLPKLIVGKAFVSQDAADKTLKNGGKAFVIYFTKNKSIECEGWLKIEHNGWEQSIRPWASIYVNNESYELLYPLMVRGDVEDTTNRHFSNFQYNGKTGTLTELNFYAKYGNKWWDRRVGHLQEGIPAFVYDVCPDFPSAKSLGTFVNTKQTATAYLEILAQDPGKRVLRPDLVTKKTIKPYDPTLPKYVK